MNGEAISIDANKKIMKNNDDNTTDVGQSI